MMDLERLFAEEGMRMVNELRIKLISQTMKPIPRTSRSPQVDMELRQLLLLVLLLPVRQLLQRVLLVVLLLCWDSGLLESRLVLQLPV